MHNWKQRLERLESVITPIAALAIVTSRTGDRMRAVARGQELHSRPGEDLKSFVARASQEFAPVGGVIVVPEKMPPGYSVVGGQKGTK